MDSTPTVDPLLSEIANEWFQDNDHFIGYGLAPIFQGAKKTGEYYVSEIENALGEPDDLERAPSTPYASVTMRLADDSYNTRDRGIKVGVDDTVRSNYREAYDADEEAVERAMRIVMTDHEKRVAAMASDSNITHQAVTTWTASNGDTIISEVQTEIEEVRKATGIKPNVWVIPNDEWIATIQHNSGLISRIKNDTNAKISTVQLDALAAVVGIEQCVVPMCLKATNKDGQTLTADDIWDQTESYLLYSPGVGAGLSAPATMRTFTWDADAGLGDIRLDSYREEDITTDWHRARAFDDVKLVGSALGRVLTGI